MSFWSVRIILQNKNHKSHVPFPPSLFPIFLLKNLSSRPLFAKKSYHSSPLFLSAKTLMKPLRSRISCISTYLNIARSNASLPWSSATSGSAPRSSSNFATWGLTYPTAMCNAARPSLRSRWYRFAPASASSFTHNSKPSPATKRSTVRPSASTTSTLRPSWSRRGSSMRFGTDLSLYLTIVTFRYSTYGKLKLVVSLSLMYYRLDISWQGVKLSISTICEALFYGFHIFVSQSLSEISVVK